MRRLPHADPRPQVVQLAPALATLATLLLLAASPVQAAAGGPTITLPPAPGTDFAQRLAHHVDESHRPGHVHDGSHDPTWPAAAPTGPFAADFENLFQGEWSIQHQEITVEVEPNTPELSGEVTVTVAIHTDGLDEVLFRLGILDTVDVVDASGAKMPHKYNTYFNQLGQVLIGLPKGLKKGDTLKIKLTYKRKLNCKQASALRFCSFDSTFWSVMFYRYYVSHGSAYHSPFTSTLHVVTPNDRRAAAPGIPSGPTQLPNKRLAWHFEQKERTSNGGFSIAEYKVTGPDHAEVEQLVEAGKRYVRFYTAEPYAFAAKSLQPEAEGILDFYGARFTEFPWAGINIVQNANNFGGGYAPLSGTFMYRNVFGAKVGAQGYTNFSELTAHELAHQWWGNYVRPMGSGDVSLSESLAEYSSCLYTELKLKNRSQLVTDNLSFVYTVGEKDDRPMQATNVYGSPKYVQIIYHKGAVVLHMLRHEIGDENMNKGLAAFAKAYGRDYARVADLQKSMEGATGLDLGWFFEQWWQRKGALKVEFGGRVVPRDEGGFRVKLRVKQLTDKPFRFKLPVRITHADGEVVHHNVDVIPKDGVGLNIVHIDVDKPVLTVRPDVSRKLLRRFTVLTPGDVTLDGLVDGVDLVETAFRANRGIVWNKSFFPNTLWDELFDLDGSYRVDDGDFDLIESHAGATSVEF